MIITRCKSYGCICERMKGPDGEYTSLWCDAHRFHPELRKTKPEPPPEPEQNLDGALITIAGKTYQLSYIEDADGTH